jgi:hypothetical protein
MSEMQPPPAATEGGGGNVPELGLERRTDNGSAAPSQARLKSWQTELIRAGLADRDLILRQSLSPMVRR